MKIFVLVKQRPLRVKTYTSLTALYEDNNDLRVSKSKLEKWDFTFDYIDTRYIISKTYSQSTGDVRRKKRE